jgi:glycosyltransferase domain-containing protein
MSRAAILSKTKRLITLPWRAARALKSAFLSIRSIESKISALACQLREAEVVREKANSEILDRLSAGARMTSKAVDLLKKQGNGHSLTIVIPTRNRPVLCAAQLRFFRDCAVSHRIVVADSSDVTQSEEVRKACDGIADYHHFDSRMSMVEKMANAIGKVETPCVVLAPDDDVTFPHAIDAALDALGKDDGYVAAGGNVLRFGMHENYIDIHGVFSATPAIDDDDPLRRHYQLMRDYRPFLWSVFRTPVFATAMNAAAKVEGAIFQEIAFMGMVVLQGKIIQLPVVYAMRGGESPLMPRTEIDPFLWYLEDAGEFFGHFSGYRNALIAAIKAMNISVPDEPKLKQLLGLAHGAWLGRVVDVGKINHTARVMLGDDLAPIYMGPEWAGWREIGPIDLVHPSATGRREYVWREAVTSAQPNHEIAVSAAEMECVEKQFDSYSFT